MVFRYLHRLIAVLTILSIIWLSFYSQYHHHKKHDDCKESCCSFHHNHAENDTAKISIKSKDIHFCSVCKFLKYNNIISIFQNSFSFDFFIYQPDICFVLIAKDYKILFHKKPRAPPFYS